MAQKTIYATVKLVVKTHGKLSDDDLTTRIAEQVDYSFKHKDDVCEIIDTELLDVTTWVSM